MQEMLTDFRWDIENRAKGISLFPFRIYPGSLSLYLTTRSLELE